MKKLVSIVLLFTLVLLLSGCGLNGGGIVNEGDTIIEYDGEPVYTKEEIDEMLDFEIDKLYGTAFYYNCEKTGVENVQTCDVVRFYTQDEVDNLINERIWQYAMDVEQDLEALEQRIEEQEIRINELENPGGE